MLTTALLLAIESTLNKLISSDSVTSVALGKLEGSAIEIRITDWQQSIFIIPYQGGLQLQNRLEYSADVTLEGRSNAFLSMLTSDNKAAFMFGNGVDITGKSGIANQLQTIFAKLEIDWPALLAEHTGDLLADKIVNRAHNQTAQAKQVVHSLNLNLTEYIQEEIHLLPSSIEAELQFADIDGIREQADRLSARVELLEKSYLKRASETKVK